MDQLLLEASDLIESLRYLDDLDLINEDVAGCAADARDVIIEILR